MRSNEEVVGMARRVPAVFLLLLSCGGLASCSGTSTAPTTTPAPRTDDAGVLATLCSGVVAADLGEGTLCVDSGFRMDTDRFSFVNWGRSTAADDNVTVQTLVDLFGHSQVCMPGPESECVLRPRTVQVLHDWNVALNGGRCEGMAVLSQRMFLRYDTPQDFGGSFATAADLTRSAPDLAPALVHWWATQFVPEVARPAAASRLRTPAQLVADLIEGLANGEGQTVGMYHRGAGHSVAPFAVTRRGDTWVVHVYDNNDPRTRREILVRPADSTWSYEATDGEWSGTTGSLELTPMSARSGPFTCPFCADDAGSPTEIMVTHADGAVPSTVTVDAGGRGRIEQTAQGYVGAIDGAAMEPVKGSDKGAARLHVPAAVADMQIELRGTEGVPHPAATVTVRRSGHPSIQVQGVLPAAETGAARVTSPFVTTAAGHTVVTAAGGSVTVVIAGDANLGTVTLADGDSLEVSRLRTTAGSGPVVDVTLHRDGAESRVTLELAPGEATETELTAKNGTLTATATAATARKVSSARRVRTSPLASSPGTTATTAGTVPTVDVTLPG
ncbi:MAG: hypothetical protein ACKOBO_00115 [Acidimicrobiales bacterium]